MNEHQIPLPYVGVSGVATYEQHGCIVDIALEEELLGDDHFVMIGIQASTKTQLRNIENARGRNWYPVGDDLANAAGNEDSGLTKPFIHCSFENDEDLERGVPIVMGRALYYARGVQLNRLAWMTTDYLPFLENFHARWPHREIVLQAHEPLLQEYKPQELVKRLGKLPVDYVLFDASLGFGKELDVTSIRPYVDAVYQAELPMGVSVAGGLDAVTVPELFAPLCAEFPDLSCDAEGRLRTGPHGRSELDLQKVAAYIHAWKACIGSYTR